MNNLWLIYALLSAFMAALVPIFGKIGLQNADANTATAIRAIIMAVFLIFCVIIQGHLNKFYCILCNKKAMLFITLSGIVGALSWLFYFLALKHGKVAQVAPVDKFSVVLATAFAIIFFGEKLSISNWIGVIFITCGVICIALS